jgi:curved DNA-binding protein CbpA
MVDSIILVRLVLVDRKLLLKYHPDKQTGQPVVTDSTDSLFLSIQKAYDTLSDESKRRSYDSQFEFDESIPSGTETTDFYKVRLFIALGSVCRLWQLHEDVPRRTLRYSCATAAFP